MTLLEATHELLNQALKAGVTIREIAPEGGAVDYEWLKKYRQGGVKDPSVNRIQALHDRLHELRKFRS